MEHDTPKGQRFKALLENYAIALHLTDQLIDSGLLNRKIKITQKNVEEISRELMIAVASDLREAKKIKDIYISEEVHVIQICKVYFDELALRGNEWVEADLYDLFLHLQKETEETLSKGR